MALQEMAGVGQDGLIGVTEDIYDDGYLRVEHRNYYAACEGSPIKLPRTEVLMFSRLTRTPNRIVALMSFGVPFGGLTSRSILRACTFTSIASVQSSPNSACKSKRWSMSDIA